MSNHSLTARGTDLPYLHKSVVRLRMSRILFAAKHLFVGSYLQDMHVMGSRPMKGKEKIYRMINYVIC